MGKASRSKGKRGELEAAHALEEAWGIPGIVRSAQVSGKFSEDLLRRDSQGKITRVLPDFHLEVKRYARISALRWTERARADSGITPVVVMREDGDPEWYVLTPAWALFALTKNITDAQTDRP